MMRPLLPAALCALLCASLLSCGNGRGESPESFAVQAFGALQSRDRNRYLALQGSLEDVVRSCPTITAPERAEVVVELAAAREEATRAFDGCMALLNLDGAVFQSALREPDGGEVITLRWTGCEPSLQFPAMRIHFTKGGVRGSLRITQVMEFAGPWRFRGAVRQCEQMSP